MCFNLAHHALGFVVTGITLATIFMTFEGPIPMFNLLIALPIMMVGWLIKSTNDMNAIERIAKNQARGEEELITGGWYNFSRNPCYLGQALITGGFLLIAPSIYSLGCYLTYFLIMNATVSVEEKRLKAKFGNEYEAYAKEVGRWLTLKRT